MDEGTSLRRQALWLPVLLASQACGTSLQEQSASQAAAGTVRIVYVVPSDRSPEPELVSALNDAAADMRAWYAQELEGSTITFAASPVETVRSTRASTWFASNPDGPRGLRFWNNSIAEAGRLAGARFDDPSNRWILYVDAPTECGQQIGGANGVAVMASRDVDGLLGRSDTPYCADEAPDRGGTCRWVGGLAHELGHALGLHHPPGCDPQTASCDESALMAFGWQTYPAAHLTDADRTTLRRSPFFAIDEAAASSGGLCVESRRYQDSDDTDDTDDTDDVCEGCGRDATAPADWACDAAWYGADDGCDCGCGAADPDCDGAAQEPLGCGDGEACCDGVCCAGDEAQDCNCRDDCAEWNDCCDDCGGATPQCNCRDDCSEWNDCCDDCSAATTECTCLDDCFEYGDCCDDCSEPSACTCLDDCFEYDDCCDDCGEPGYCGDGVCNGDEDDTWCCEDCACVAEGTECDEWGECV